MDTTRKEERASSGGNLTSRQVVVIHGRGVGEGSRENASSISRSRGHADDGSRCRPLVIVPRRVVDQEQGSSLKPKGPEATGTDLKEAKGPGNSDNVEVCPPCDVEILQVGLVYAGFGIERQNVSPSTNMRRFREHYGIGSKACASLMSDLNLLVATNNDEEQPPLPLQTLQDILMTLNWLKAYPTEGTMAGVWDRDEKTIRKKVRAGVRLIASLKETKIRFEDFKEEEIFVVSVDGIHCTIFEPRKDPSTKWYSHKSNSAALTYELAVAIQSNRLVWIRGPLPASQHDITTFRGGKIGEAKSPNALIFQIPDGTKAIGDSGYRGEPNKISVSRPADTEAVRKFKGRVKARHETFNSRLKAFKILSTRFRHKLSIETMDEHRVVFVAICVLCQYDMESGHGLFQV